MKSGDSVATAEWRGPGEVVLEVADPQRRRWLEAYFKSEDSFLGGEIDCAELYSERRDSSKKAFVRALFSLESHSYRVRESNGLTRPDDREVVRS